MRICVNLGYTPTSPRGSVLAPAECSGLLAFRSTGDEFIRHHTFLERDLPAMRQRRGHDNRAGFAVQLYFLCYPGFALPAAAEPLHISARNRWPPVAR